MQISEKTNYRALNDRDPAKNISMEIYSPLNREQHQTALQVMARKDLDSRITGLLRLNPLYKFEQIL